MTITCKGGKCPEPMWCREECECLWDRWNNSSAGQAAGISPDPVASGAAYDRTCAGESHE